MASLFSFGYPVFEQEQPWFDTKFKYLLSCFIIDFCEMFLAAGAVRHEELLFEDSSPLCLKIE